MKIKLKKPKIEYYAVASESSYYVKKGTTQQIPEEEVDSVFKSGKFKFCYSDNHHWDEDELKCIVVKKTTSYEVVDIKTEVEYE